MVRHDDGSFEYVVNPDHLDYEVPCTPFKSADERERMQDYVKRNWFTCDYRPDGPDKPASGCHNTYHFDDVAIQRNGFDRSFQGTNEHDLVAVIGAAIAVLKDKPAPPPFSIKDKKEALLLLTHFVGDLHQPLHVASAYLDANGKLVDPDVAHHVDLDTETIGGNAIGDQNLNLHHEWDDIPTDIGEACNPGVTVGGEGGCRQARERWRIGRPNGHRTRSWSRMMPSRGLSFQRTDPPPKVGWSVAFDDHTVYLWSMDIIKRRQLAKGGARLAEILNAIWP